MVPPVEAGQAPRAYGLRRSGKRTTDKNTERITRITHPHQWILAAGVSKAKA